MGIFIAWLFFALLVGFLGQDRTIGFWISFLLSIVLSPVIGLIIVLLSKTNTQAELEKGMIDHFRQSSKPSLEETEAKLKKIQQMRDDKTISELEYALMRKEVLRNAH